MEQCSETSAYKTQTPGNYPEENIQHTEHGESLKSIVTMVRLSGRNLGLSYLPKQSSRYSFCWGKTTGSATGSDAPFIVEIRNALYTLPFPSVFMTWY